MYHQNRWMKLCGLLIVAIVSMPVQVFAAESVTASQPTNAKLHAQPVNPKAGAVKIRNENLGPVRVRIALKLTPYESVNMRSPGGQSIAKQVALQPVEQILRARLEQTNHFYFGNWHVESVPLRWQKATSQYSVQLNVYKRYGRGSEIEEKIGSIRVDGQLEESGLKLYTLVGTSQSEIANSHGTKVLELAAGTSKAVESEPNAKPLVGSSGQVTDF